MKNFRTLQLAIKFNHQLKDLTVPVHLRDQLERAAASIALNLAEGWGRSSTRDRERFITIALGSARECQAALMIAGLDEQPVWTLLDSVCAHIYKLLHAERRV